jgi:16S rRNA (guanine966-N2)-methyltransferase
MRIIGGLWRGRKIEAPPENDRQIRPTSDRVRENMFNILVSRFGGSLADLHVADLCAGTGALGLEALSRGAATCIFIEKDHRTCELIERNIVLLNAKTAATVLRADVEQLSKARQPVDLILFDPPYGADFVPQVLKSLILQNWAGQSTLLCMEQHAKAEAEFAAWQLADERNYGKTKLIFLKNDE